ncbi:uncharacterized protein [Macrobrachium rosenbergii]|uniref:uncharacterized protein n=1 Tax=Macrobrachium rosenbergii TaxID=79674 RepID=UPI0034D60063
MYSYTKGSSTVRRTLLDTMSAVSFTSVLHALPHILDVEALPFQCFFHTAHPASPISSSILFTFLASCAVLLFSVQDGCCLSVGSHVAPEDYSSNNVTPSILKRHFILGSFGLGNNASDFHQIHFTPGNFTRDKRNIHPSNPKADNTTGNIVKRQIILSNFGLENSTDGTLAGIPPPGKGYLLGHGIFFVSGYAMRRKKHANEARERAQSSEQNGKSIKSPFEMGLPIVLQHTPGDQVTNIINIGKFNQPEELEAEQIKMTSVSNEDLSQSSYEFTDTPESATSGETSQKNADSGYDGEYYDDDYDNTGYDYYEYYDSQSDSPSSLGGTGNPKTFAHNGERKPASITDAGNVGTGNQQTTVPVQQFDHPSHNEPSSYSSTEDIRPFDSTTRTFQQEISTSSGSLRPPASLVSSEDSKQHGPLATSERLQLPQTHISISDVKSEGHRPPESLLKPPASSEPILDNGGIRPPNSFADKERPHPSQSFTTSFVSDKEIEVLELPVLSADSNELDSYSSYEPLTETDHPNRDVIRSPDSSQGMKRQRLSSLLGMDERSRPRVHNSANRERIDPLPPALKSDESETEKLDSLTVFEDNSNGEILSSYTSFEDNSKEFPSGKGTVSNGYGYQTTAPKLTERNKPQNPPSSNMYGTPKSFQRNGRLQESPSHSPERDAELNISDSSLNNGKDHNSFGRSEKIKLSGSFTNTETNEESGHISNDRHDILFTVEDDSDSTYTTVPQFTDNDVLLNDDKNNAKNLFTGTDNPKQHNSLPAPQVDREKSSYSSLEEGSNKPPFEALHKIVSSVISNIGLQAPSVVIHNNGDSNRSSYSSLEIDNIDNNIGNNKAKISVPSVNVRQDSFDDYDEKVIEMYNDYDDENQHSESLTDYDEDAGQSSYLSFERLDENSFANDLQSRHLDSLVSNETADHFKSFVNTENNDRRPFVQESDDKHAISLRGNEKSITSRLEAHDSLLNHENKSQSSLPEFEIFHEEADADSYVSYVRDEDFKELDSDDRGDDIVNLNSDLESRHEEGCPSGKKKTLETENISNDHLGKSHSFEEKLRQQHVNPTDRETHQVPSSFERGSRHFASDKIQVQPELFDSDEKINQPLLLENKEGKMQSSSLDTYGRARHSNSFGRLEMIPLNDWDNNSNSFRINDDIRPPKALSIEAEYGQNESFTTDQKIEDRKSLVENESDVHAQSSASSEDFIIDSVTNERRSKVLESHSVEERNGPQSFPLGERFTTSGEFSINERPGPLNSFKKGMVGRQGEVFAGSEGSITLPLTTDSEVGQHGLIANSPESTRHPSSVEKEIFKSPILDSGHENFNYPQTFSIDGNIRPPRTLFNNESFKLLNLFHSDNEFKQANSFSKIQDPDDTESNKGVGPDNPQISVNKEDIVIPEHFATSAGSESTASFPIQENFSPEKFSSNRKEDLQLKSFPDNKRAQLFSPTLNSGYGLRLIVKRPATISDKNYSTTGLSSKTIGNDQPRNLETTTNHYTSSAGINRFKIIQDSIIATDANLRPREFSPINDVNMYKKVFSINRGFVPPPFVTGNDEKNLHDDGISVLDDDRRSANIKFKRASEEDDTELVADHKEDISNTDIFSHFTVDTLSERGVNSTSYVVSNNESSSNANDHTAPLVQSVNFSEFSDLLKGEDGDFDLAHGNEPDDFYDMTIYKIDNGNVTNVTQNLTDFIHNLSSLNSTESISNIMDALRLMHAIGKRELETDSGSTGLNENNGSPIVIFHQNSGEALSIVQDGIENFVPSSSDGIKPKAPESSQDDLYVPLYPGRIGKFNVKVNLDSRSGKQIDDITITPFHSQLGQNFIQSDNNKEQHSLSVNQEAGYSGIEDRDKIGGFTDHSSGDIGLHQVDHAQTKNSNNQGYSFFNLGEQNLENLENSQFGFIKDANKLNTKPLDNEHEQMALPLLMPLNTETAEEPRSLLSNTLSENVQNFPTVLKDLSQQGRSDAEIITQTVAFFNKGNQTTPNVDGHSAAGNRVVVKEDFNTKSFDTVSKEKLTEGFYQNSDQTLQEEDSQLSIPGQFPATNFMLSNLQRTTQSQYADPQLLNQKVKGENHHNKITPFNADQKGNTESQIMNPVQSHYDNSMYTHGNMNAHDFGEGQALSIHSIQNAPDTTFQSASEQSDEEQGTIDIRGFNANDISENKNEDDLSESVATFINAFTRLTPGGRERVESDTSIQGNLEKALFNENDQPLVGTTEEEYRENSSHGQPSADTENLRESTGITKIQNLDNFVSFPALTDTSNDQVSFHLNQGNQEKSMTDIEGRSLFDFLNNETSPGESVANENIHNPDKNFANFQSAFTDFPGILRSPFNQRQQLIPLQDDQAKSISNERIQNLDNLVSLQPPVNPYQEDFAIHFSQISPQDIVTKAKEIDLVSIPRFTDDIKVMHANGQVVNKPDVQVAVGNFVRESTQSPETQRYFSDGNVLQSSSSFPSHQPMVFSKEFIQDQPGPVTGDMENSVLSKIQEIQKTVGAMPMNGNEFGSGNEFHNIEAAVTDFARSNGRQLLQEVQPSALMKNPWKGINNENIKSLGAFGRLIPPLNDSQQELAKHVFPEQQTPLLLETPGNGIKSENIISQEDSGQFQSQINDFHEILPKQEPQTLTLLRSSGNSINGGNIRSLNNFGLQNTPLNDSQEDVQKQLFQEQQNPDLLKGPENVINNNNINRFLHPPINDFQGKLVEHLSQGHQSSAVLQRPKNDINSEKIISNNFSHLQLPIHDFQGELPNLIHGEQMPASLDRPRNGINTENIKSLQNFGLLNPSINNFQDELPKHLSQEQQTSVLLQSPENAINSRNTVSPNDLGLLHPPINDFQSELPKPVFHEQPTFDLPERSENGIISESTISLNDFSILHPPINNFQQEATRDTIPIGKNPITSSTENSTSFDFPGFQVTVTNSPVVSSSQQFVANINENSRLNQISAADGHKIQFVGNLRPELFPVTIPIISADLNENSGFPGIFSHPAISGINFTQETGTAESRLSTNADHHGNENTQSNIITDLEMVEGREGNINLNNGGDFFKELPDTTSQYLAFVGQQVNDKGLPAEAFSTGKTQESGVNDQMGFHNPDSELHSNGFAGVSFTSNENPISFLDVTNGRAGNTGKDQPLIDIRNEQGSSKDIVSKQSLPFFPAVEVNLNSNLHVIPHQLNPAQGGTGLPEIAGNIHNIPGTFMDSQITGIPEQLIRGQGTASAPDSFEKFPNKETIQTTNEFPNVQAAVTEFAGEFKGFKNQGQEDQRHKENQVKTTVDKKLHKSDHSASIQPAINNFKWDLSGQFIKNNPEQIPANLQDNSFNFPNVKTTIIAVPVESPEQIHKEKDNIDITFNREQIVDTGFKIQPAVAIDLGRSDLSIQENQGKLLNGEFSASTIQPPPTTKVILVRYNDRENSLNIQGSQENFGDEENDLVGLNIPEHQTPTDIGHLGQINQDSGSQTEVGQFARNNRLQLNDLGEGSEGSRLQLGVVEHTSQDIRVETEDLGHTGQNITPLTDILEETGENMHIDTLEESTENTEAHIGSTGDVRQSSETQTDVLGRLLQNSGSQTGSDTLNSSESQESSEFGENSSQLSGEHNCGGEWIPIYKNEQ